jgi:hypothetical protein
MQLASPERLIDSGCHRTVNELIRHIPARVQPEALVLRRGRKADAANALSAPRGGNRSGFRRVAVGETQNIGMLARTRLLWRRCGVNRVRNSAATASPRAGNHFGITVITNGITIHLLGLELAL